MSTSTTTARAMLRAAATLAATALLVSGCSAPAATELAQSTRPLTSLTLQMGALLPQTGGLSQYAPVMRAAFELAVQEVNEAGLGVTIEAEVRDSGDSTSETGPASLTELLDLGSSVIIGPLSDGVSRKVVAQAVSAGALMISPGSTSADFSTYDDDGLFWRTSPSCALQGNTLGAAAGEHGHRTLAVVAQADLCGSGLPLAVAAGFKGAGGKVSLSGTFDTTAAREALVAKVIAQRPDAVAILATDSAVSIATALLAAGFTGDELYFTGIAIGSHAEHFSAGALVGAHATRPGLDVARLGAFTDRLLDLDPGLTEFVYAAETYDAVIVAALAALAAQSVRGEDIAGALRAVTGGKGAGEKVTSFTAAALLLRDGAAVDYDGPSGGVAFDASGDPTGAVIGLFEYGADETFTRVN